jgi:hypothetical protein
MKASKLVFLLFLLIFSASSIFGQIESPVLITILDSQVAETSGLLFYDGKLWTHNDSGAEPHLYCIDTTNGLVLFTKVIRNADNYDWEDICKDDDFAYIGDIGNNAGNRESLQIYKISLADLNNEDLDSIDSELITFTYDPLIYPEIGKDNDTEFDCEAMIAKDDSLFLFSKCWLSKQCHVYALPKEAGNYIAYRKDTLNTQGLICGADYNAETNQIALIGYVYGVPAPSLLFVLSDFTENDFFSGTNTRTELELNGYQTESVIFRDNSRLWITNENFLGHAQGLYEISLLDENYNSDISVKSTLLIYPNPASEIIIISYSKAEKFKYRIIDSCGNVVVKSCQKQNFQEPVEINVENLSSGKFYIELTGKNSKISTAFIKL